MDDKRVMTMGVVVFYRPDYSTKTIKEITRTGVLVPEDAMNIYANTPNPASQVVFGSDETHLKEELQKLEENIKDPKWLEDLFECI